MNGAIQNVNGQTSLVREASPLAPRGILWHTVGRGHLSHARWLPATELRELVEHYWFVRWDLRGEEPFLQETLPHPCVHWVTEGQQSTLQGVPRGRFSRLLEGQQRAFGVKFKPGGFYPFYRAPVRRFASRGLTLEAAFGADGAEFEGRLRSRPPDTESDEPLMEMVERFLLDRLPAHDERLREVQDMVQAIMDDRTLTRVDDVALRFGVHRRALQRLFALYVGASPKWVIQRYRLHEALELAAAGETVNWSRLAMDLGYADQSHFIKDFRALIGRSPTEYVKALTPKAR